MNLIGQTQGTALQSFPNFKLYQKMSQISKCIPVNFAKKPEKLFSKQVSTKVLFCKHEEHTKC